MRRWHTSAEEALMRARFRYEFEVNHQGIPDNHIACACSRGIGYYRKKTPNGCSCYGCRHWKFDPKRRRQVRERAIAVSLGEPERVLRQRKNRKRWCRGKVGVAHCWTVVEVRRPAWRPGTVFVTWRCTACGKKS